jgi:hypothetical protein
MTRLLLCILTFLACYEAHASDYVFRDGYYWNGGQAYTRSSSYKCCTSPTGYCYKYTPVYIPAKANVTTTNTNYSYVYNLSYSQPAAEQGNTVFGYSPQLSLQSYGALDLGATIDGLLRLSSDMQAGASGVAGDVKALTTEAAALVAANNQAVAAVAELQAKTELLKAAQPSPQLNLNIGGKAEQNQVFAAGAPGPLVTQHCTNCHVAGKDGFAKFNLASLVAHEGRSAAIDAVATGHMPKGVELDAATRLALIAEINGGP